jgi:hypothetical protein
MIGQCKRSCRRANNIDDNNAVIVKSKYLASIIIVYVETVLSANKTLHYVDLIS